MFIYKFTHIETSRCYIGQTIQDPNRRRLEEIYGVERAKLRREARKNKVLHNV